MSIQLTLGGRAHHVTVVRRRPSLVLAIDGKEHEISLIPNRGDGRNEIAIDGHRIRFTRAECGGSQFVRFGGQTFEIGFVDPFSASGGGVANANALKAPMPGAVVSIQKGAGDTVSRGEAIMTIESMKLQTVLSAPRDGIIAAVLKNESDTFEKDELLVTLELEDEKA